MRYILLLLLIPFISFGQLAFPTAKGFGRATTGGAGGIILHVTNLNDSGTGSLRAAIDRNVARTIVFDVGGDILLTGNHYGIYASQGEGDLTIAGETAPFPGITIRGDNIAASSYGGTFDISASNIIIRYISVRENNNNRTDNDAIRIRNDAGMTNIILDHVSMSHGADENLSTKGITNGTIQNCMLTNSDTSYNFLFGQENYNFSFLENYLSHTDQRNILVGYGKLLESSEWINNVIYGHKEGMYLVYGNVVDVIGNVYKAFPALVPNFASIQWSANQYNNPNALVTDGSFYVENNYLLNPQGRNLYNGNIGTYGENTRQITNSVVTSWETTRVGIENRVFSANVGNSLHRDDMDIQAIADYTSGAGNWSGPNVPNKTLFIRPVADDADTDDMLDYVEQSLWGSNGTTNAPNGFTNTDWVSRVDGSNLNAFTNIRKTHFWLAGDLMLANDPGNPVGDVCCTISNSRASNSALMNN